MRDLFFERSAFGSRNAANNPNDKPKKHHKGGIQRNIEDDAYCRDGIAKEIVFVAVSHNDDESGWP